MAKTATLADVAERSQVSISTVSLVLRNKGAIPQETRQRVLDAARALGYRAKGEVSHGPSAKPISTIGVIAKASEDDSPLANPFYSQVLAGIEVACRQRKINMLFATLLTDRANYPLEIPRLLMEQHADGLLLVGALVDRALEAVLEKKDVPVVLVDAYAPYHDFDSVVSDNRRGMYQAVSYLVSRGHRNIALVGGQPETYPSIRERREGYLEALADFALPVYDSDTPSDQNELEPLLEAFMAAHKEVTALACINDQVALTAMRIVERCGRRAPQDISVIGFDDIAAAQRNDPPLATMRVDKLGMGLSALQMLNWRMGAPAVAPMTLVLRPTLVERESVGAPSARA